MIFSKGDKSVVQSCTAGILESKFKKFKKNRNFRIKKAREGVPEWFK